MDIKELMTRLEAIGKEAKTVLDEVQDEKALGELKVKFLGKKGELASIMKEMSKLSKEERPKLGEVANQVRESLTALIEERLIAYKEKALKERLEKETIDVTLPGREKKKGGLHPLSLVIEEAISIFTSLGFEVAEGPEIESDYYNFQALNLAKDHPARDMQDTFYIDENIVLRSQTSPVQIRTMEKKEGKVPVKIICPGRVYRKDDDATHSPMFHQIEGLVIGEDITMADLKGTLLHFVREIFEKEVELRLRPSYFPFTEPSAEVDISCVSCGGTGCRVCSHTGWLEILGAGMVHPNVLRAGGYDPTKVRGFAFGMGVERIAMLKYGINDLRLLFANDIRTLKQF